MSQWDHNIEQPMPGPFSFPNSRKGPGIEVDVFYTMNLPNFMIRILPEKYENIRQLLWKIIILEIV